MPQTEPGRDAVLATPGLAAGGLGALTANDLLLFLSIVYMAVLLGFTLYRWWVLHFEVRQWKAARKIDPTTPPPSRLTTTKPGDLDE